MITNTVIFTFFVGLLSGLVITGAIVWARDLRLRMTWWKWVLAAVWFILLDFFVLLAFTMIGEGETGAGMKMLFVFGIIMFILGVGLARLLWSGREVNG